MEARGSPASFHLAPLGCQFPKASSCLVSITARTTGHCWYNCIPTWVLLRSTPTFTRFSNCESSAQLSPAHTCTETTKEEVRATIVPTTVLTHSTARCQDRQRERWSPRMRSSKKAARHSILCSPGEHAHLTQKDSTEAPPSGKESISHGGKGCTNVLCLCDHTEASNT